MISLCQRVPLEAIAFDKLWSDCLLDKRVGTHFAIVEVAVTIVAEGLLVEFVIVLY